MASLSIDEMKLYMEQLECHYKLRRNFFKISFFSDMVRGTL